ncbi:P-loop containing nucleoside triphosphate hydrolase protein [Hygrophoropsis aurantiaca]|uniref:P-loop containing nucleoside triphosphate hydrolase protein n=1 Tax=Hygrophoropsis aurantiaca TaxID=72124 RepID=A0ACB8AAA9_9AGAM|nr:P-loop containing nucleoside triphosphate hydrolase protein [Hygrophoropsis aurantiaca]
MAPVHSRISSHKRNQDRAARLLSEAREKAAKDTGYHSLATRQKISEEFKSRTNMTPYNWQVDVAEALVLGLDCSVIAGTGAGKTMPFVMPLFVHPEKTVIVISPLNALEADQAERFKKMKIAAVAVNGETYSTTLHKELEQNKFQAIITSPEMCLQHDKFRQLLSNPRFAARIAAIVIDEAHCISQWGDHFRDLYNQLGTLRAFVPHHVPFLVTSATLPPLVLAHVQAVTHILPSQSYHVNLGTDRPNISWEVRYMKNGKSDLESLSFLLPKNSGGEAEGDTYDQSLVFFDDINVSMSALRWLRDHSPKTIQHQISVYHSRRTPTAKRIVLKLFKEGKIKVLLSTEAAGMGCDMPHIQQVVQFMAPGSLSIWMQRAGRAGRTLTMNARAILLVQPSVFQEKRTKKGKDPDEDDDGESIKYVKQIEDGLRQWIETEGCRRDIADEYFDSGVQRKGELLCV